MMQECQFATAVFFALLLAGCAHQSRADSGSTAPRPGIYRVESGERLDRDTFYEEIAAATFVVVGERHTVEWHHRVQTDIYRALLQRSPPPVALGMEMFQRPFQEPLDAYATGSIDERTMLSETEWETRWGADPALYRPLWRAAREHGTRIVALNARRELTKKIAREGIEGLSKSERSALPPVIDTSIEAQRSYVRRAFERHEGTGEMNFEYFLQAQATWDETMAATALEAVRGGDTETMMIVAGRAHARRDFGIPKRLERELDESSGARVVSILPYDREGDAFPGIREAPSDFVWLR